MAFSIAHAPLLNGVKMIRTDEVGVSKTTPNNYYNTLYKNLDTSIMQRATSPIADKVACVAIRDDEPLRIQIWRSASFVPYFSFFMEDDEGNLKPLYNPTNYTITENIDSSDRVRTLNLDLSSVDQSSLTGLRRYLQIIVTEVTAGGTPRDLLRSEPFYIETATSIPATSAPLDIEYSHSVVGEKSGYYWGTYGEKGIPTQRFTLLNADLLSVTGATDKNVAESIEGGDTILKSFTLNVSTYKIFNVPLYLADKTIKAFSVDTTLVNGVPMTLDGYSVDPLNKGLVNLTLELKERDFNGYNDL